MQYKIPVHIENEDPIVLWLSLRQLAIIMIFWWLWYSLFTSMAPSTWVEIALIPALLIFWIGVMIAVFRYSEMTFIPFILAFVRFKSNTEERKWDRWIDSFQPMDIWHLTSVDTKKVKSIDFTDKIDKIKELEDKVDKI